MNKAKARILTLGTFEPLSRFRLVDEARQGSGWRDQVFGRVRILSLSSGAFPVENAQLLEGHHKKDHRRRTHVLN